MLLCTLQILFNDRVPRKIAKHQIANKYYNYIKTFIITPTEKFIPS